MLGSVLTMEISQTLPLMALNIHLMRQQMEAQEKLQVAHRLLLVTQYLLTPLNLASLQLILRRESTSIFLMWI